MRASVVCLLLTLPALLAGCSGNDKDGAGPEEPIDDGTVAPKDLEVLGGWIFDPALAPVEGASVTIPALNHSTETTPEGHYGFTGLPYNQVIVVVVQAEGYESNSKAVTLSPDTILLLNFTLKPVSEKVAFSERLSFNGLISCGGVIKVQNQPNDIECGISGGVDERVWEFTVKPDVAGIVVEIIWEAGTPAAEHLNLTIETVGFGNFDEVLAGNEGESILRGQVNRFQSERFYTEGGILRVTVDSGRNAAQDETGTGVGLAVQQDFEAFATVFYVDGPPPGYSIANV